MKQIVCGLITVVALFAFSASAAFAAESIEQYDVHIKINKDSSIEIRESIDYNFGSELRKGIFRTVPVIVKDDGKRYRLNIKNTSAFDDAGNDQLFDVTEGRSEVRIDVGSDVREFGGVQRFHIRYTVEAALEHESEYDRLHWDAVGADWEVFIRDARVTVELPEPVSEDLLQSDCFAGLIGSVNPCTKTVYQYTDESPGESEGGLEDEDREDVLVAGIVYSHSRSLGQGRGITVDVRFPKGVVSEAEREDVPSVPPIFLLLLAGAGIAPLYGVIWLFRKGTDPGHGKAVVNQYDVPRGVTPAQAGFIKKRKFGNDELVAELLSLAIRGYIKIVHGKRRILFFFPSYSFLFLKLKSGGDLSSTERSILESIFNKRFLLTKHEALDHFSDPIPGLDEDIRSALALSSTVRLKRYKKTFQRFFKKIQKTAKEEVEETGLFENDFKSARFAGAKTAFLYLAGAGISAALILLVIFFLYPTTPLDVLVDGTITFAILCLIVFFFLFSLVISRRLPQRSEKGADLYRHMLGLKRYIKVAEKERMEFHFDPRKNPELFEKLLPFAVVFGEQKSWVGHLSELEYSPQWYGSSNPGSLSVNGLNSMVGSLSSTSSSSSGSGGSSGVGGGSGGGGGGSR